MAGVVNLNPEQREQLLTIKAKIEELEAEVAALTGEKVVKAKLAKIRFNDDETCARALKGLASRMRITVFKDETFIVPEAGLAWLTTEGLTCEFLGWVNQDNVVQTLRDNLTHPV